MSISQLLIRKWIFFSIGVKWDKMSTFLTFLLCFTDTYRLLHSSSFDKYVCIDIYPYILHIHLVYILNKKQKTLSKEIFKCFQLHF